MSVDRKLTQSRFLQLSSLAAIGATEALKRSQLKIVGARYDLDTGAVEITTS